MSVCSILCIPVMWSLLNMSKAHWKSSWWHFYHLQHVVPDDSIDILMYIILFIYSLLCMFQFLQATYGAALRTKGSRSSLRSGPERENGGVGSSPDFPKSMSTVPIARSSAVSLVWSLTGGLCVPLNHPIQPHGILYHYTLTATMSYLFKDVSPLIQSV